MALSNQTVTSGLVKGLGPVDATTIVLGSMIGSGVFIVSADIARQVNSPGLLMLTWAVTAVLTLIAALSYGELAAAMPHAGGQYVYLREAFGPLSGFLFGWTMFLVIQTGTVAAVAVAFAKFLGVFAPWFSADNKLLPFLSSQQLMAILVIVFLTWVNTRGIRTGARVQNVFTIAKIGALLFYGAALLSLFLELPPLLTQVLQIGTLLLFVAHALEVVLCFRWIRLYEGGVALSIVLTLLFGFVHWLPIKKRALANGA